MRVFAFLLLCVAPLFAQSLSGRRAPSFSLPDSSSAQHDILDYRGKWLLLDFMRTDCPHCLALSHVLEKVKAQFGAQVAILSIVIAPPENTSTVGRYLLDNKLTTTVVFDQGQVAATYFKLTPSRSSYDTPHLFVVNPAGNIVQDWSDAAAGTEILEGGGLVRELQALMAGGSKAPGTK
jgi:peroxiredoxin